MYLYFVYIYMYLYIFVKISMYLYTCFYVYIFCISILIYICLFFFLQIYIYICMCVCLFKCIYICIYMHIYIPFSLYTYASTVRGETMDEDRSCKFLHKPNAWRASTNLIYMTQVSQSLKVHESNLLQKIISFCNWGVFQQPSPNAQPSSGVIKWHPFFWIKHYKCMPGQVLLSTIFLNGLSGKAALCQNYWLYFINNFRKQYF